MFCTIISIHAACRAVAATCSTNSTRDCYTSSIGHAYVFVTSLLFLFILFISSQMCGRDNWYRSYRCLSCTDGTSFGTLSTTLNLATFLLFRHSTLIVASAVNLVRCRCITPSAHRCLQHVARVTQTVAKMRQLRLVFLRRPRP